MWKDFFYYSKSERRSILTLLSIGILLLLGGVVTHTQITEPVVFIDSLSVDSFCVAAYHKSHVKDSLSHAKGPAGTIIHFNLSPFDPNTADSVRLCKLGLPPFIARRIINYRVKGGVFRKVEDLARIYGLSKQEYQRLQPYIVINTDSVGKASVVSRSLSDRLATTVNDHRFKDSCSLEHPLNHQNPRLMKYPEGTVIDLNTADTTQLKHIPGIGRSLAKMIVAYRNRLGGYSSVDQLQELGYVDSTVNKWFQVKSPIYRSLRVNHANLDQLRNHPYMNFYKARVILEYRRKRGKIKGLSQLSMFQEFTEKDLIRLKPYLNFE